VPEFGKERDHERDAEELFLLAKDLLHRDNAESALDALVHRSLLLLGGERGFLVLRQSEAIEHRVIRNWQESEYEEEQSPVSRSIVQQVLSSTAPLLIEDATNDPRFAQQVSVRRLMIRSVLAAPLFVGGKAAGVLYLESRSLERFFGAEELLLFQKILELSSGLLEGFVRRALLAERESSFASVFASYDLQDILTQENSVCELLLTLLRVAPSHLPVLIQAESGAGKERFARALHQNSPRKQKPLIVINCGALSPSLIEGELFGYVKGAFTGANQNKTGLIAAAHQGTLFLDEIGELPKEVQAKLLRAIQFGEVTPVGSTQPQRFDVRFVAATNRDLEAEVKEGRFRQDLLFRLNAVLLKIPPLRERPRDAALLFERFIQEAAQRLGRSIPSLSASLFAAVQAYPWPGNARELENEAHLLCTLLEPKLTAQMLSPRIKERLKEMSFSFEEPLPLLNKNSNEPKTLEQNEKDIVVHHLRIANGNKSHAAKSLGVSRETLRQMLKRHGIQ
jgi:transcriptional regulator with GAF, ATPase, and Fis domain